MPAQCSVASMVAAVDGRKLPWYALASSPRPIPPPDDAAWRERHSNLLGAPFPGQAQIEISGLVNAGGAGCTHHVQAWQRERGVASMIEDAMPDNIDPEDLPPAMRNKLEAAKQRAKAARKAAQARLRSRQAGAGKAKRDVIFEVFSPQLGLFELGVASNRNILHAYRSEGSIAGWPANSWGMITIELPGTAPDELAEGETYEARFNGADPNIYGDKQGRIRYFKRPNADAMALQHCRDGKQKAATKWAAYGGIAGAAQQVQCDRKGHFVGRQRLVSAREMTGAVTIERITAGKVVGRFELSGPARLKTTQFKLTRARDADGYVLHYPLPDDRQLKYLRKEETRTGAVTVSGRFAAPSHTADLRLMPNVKAKAADDPTNVATVVVPGAGGKKDASKEPPFSVSSHLPRLDKRNVDWARPVIRVSFNKPLDSDTVDSNSLYLAYRNGKGRMTRVPVDVKRQGGRQIRFALRKALKDGVRYRVTVKGGQQGVRSADGEALADDYTWDFYTTVNLADRESMPGLMPILEGREGIEAHVFQATRDAPLVTAKPTLTRVYGKWKPRDDVAAGWQVRRLLADVRVKNARGAALYPEKKRVHIARPDQYDSADKQRADNSVNLFNWRPKADETAKLVAEVEPADQCNAKRVFESQPLQIDYTRDAPTLSIDYYIVRAGAWAGNALSGDKSWVAPTAHRIARRGATFTTQNLPVLRTDVRYRGTIAADAGFWHRKNGVSGLLNKRPTHRLVVSQIKRTLRTQYTSADVVLLFMAGDISPAGGFSYREASGPLPGITGVFLHPDHAQAEQKAISSVAHEIVHVFLHSGGPEHYPRNQSLDVGLEGFRMAPSGRSGVNKSVTEGNGHPKGSMVYPLMRVGEDPAIANFITNENYLRLIRDMRVVRREQRLSGRTLLAARSVETLPAKAGPVWSVQGFVRAGGGAAALTGIEPVRGRAEGDSSTDSAWRAALLDTEGNVLVARAFSPQRRPSEQAAGKTQSWHAFDVMLPRQADAAKLVILHGSERVLTRARSEHAPKVEVKAVEQEGGKTTIRWQAQDADGDPLFYDVSYSPDGERYRPLALGLTGSQASFGSAELRPGSDPTLRVSAYDGFNTTRATAAVTASAGLDALATVPADDGRLSPADAIEAVFNTALNPESVDEESVSLHGPDGEPVAAEARYVPASRTIRLVSTEALEPGRRYTAKISGVTDQQGDGLDEPLEWGFKVAAQADEESAARDTEGEASKDNAATPAARGEGQGASADQAGDPDAVEVPGEKLDASELPFNKAKVRYWIKTRIATNRLQDRMKANAGDYDSVVHAFFQKREKLLKEAGWTVEAFEATEKRIMRTEGAIRLSREDDRNGYGDEQIEATRDDWPAVKPYLDELERLTDWVADNVDEPPRLRE